MKKWIVGTVLAITALTVGVALALGPNGSSTSLTVQNAAGNSGACTANSCAVAVLQVSSGTIFTPTWSVQNTVGVQVTGTWSGTITFQESQDEGATWTNAPCQPVITTGTTVSPIAVTSTTANGNWQCDVGGFTTFRAVASTLNSGTATAVIEAFAAIGNESVNSLPLLSDPQERIVQGASSGAGYVITTSADAGIGAHAMLTIQGPATGRAYLREISVCLDPLALQTTAGPRKLGVYGTTAVPTNGITAQTPLAVDPASAAYGSQAYVAGTASPLTTTPAATVSFADSSLLDAFSIMMPSAATALNPNQCIDRKYDGTQGMQPIAFGGNNGGLASFGDAGIAIADLTGGSGGVGGYIINVRFTSEPK